MCTQLEGYDEEIFEPDHSSGSSQSKSSNSHEPDPWPILAPTAYHGLAGEVVGTILPNTESDAVALLLQYVVSFGNAVGRQPYYQIENDQHYPNLYAVLVGKSAKSRKGTSAGRIRSIFEIADPDWARERTLGGMSSGEGVIELCGILGDEAIRRRGLPAPG
jgi:hypothetical protein